MEERRLLIAVALSLLVLTAYQMLFAPPPRPSPSPGAGASARPALAVSPQPGPSVAPVPGAAASPGPSAAPSAAPAPAVADEKERRVEAIGPDVSVAFTNRGARLLSWQLPKFPDARGKPEEMVPATREGLRPLEIETGRPDVDARLRDALFRPSAERVELGGQGGEVRFEFASGDLQATKVIHIPARGYLVEAWAAVSVGGQRLPVRLVWGPGVGNATAEEREIQGYQPPQAVYRMGGHVERVAAAKIGGPRVLTGAEWLGVESRHFAALWVPASGEVEAEIRAVPLPPGEDGKPHFGPLAAVGGGGADHPSLLYLGPKDYQVLSAIDHGLKDVVDVGSWIGPIVVPLMGVLRWVHGHVGNYGWAIVLLTVLINLVMAPLRHFSIANGLKMAKMSPELRAIQERYRKVPLMDPRRQEMQQETMALYEKHGLSMSTQMLVGCLPLLLTMPFLIAFYRVLNVSIELRGAPFLWIADLSHKDPFFVMPILMGVSMFLMQRMMPSAMDPAQQRIMMIMPAALSFMFLWAPAGLNLYWLASNVCSIVQQAVTMRILGPEARKARPGADRREKKK